MAEVYVGLGSNIGDKLGHLRAALRLLTGTSEFHVELDSVSSLYRTEPVGYSDQDWFLNAAVRIAVEAAPRSLLERLIAIERDLGRVRSMKNGPRTVDLDILLWDELIVDQPGLTIPHPRLHERLFVLEPLAEIAAPVRHPLLGATIAECRDALRAGIQGDAGVVRIEGPGWA